MGEGQLRMRARRRPDLCRGERIHAQFRDAGFLLPLPHGSRLDEDARIRLANNQDPDTRGNPYANPYPVNWHRLLWLLSGVGYSRPPILVVLIVFALWKWAEKKEQ